MRRYRSAWVLSVTILLLIHGNGDASENPAPLRATLQIDQAAGIEQGLHYWSGARDASLSLQAEHKGPWLILEGTLWDDIPFVQKGLGEIAPEADYRSDGIGLLLSHKDASGNRAVRCELLLAFGPHATRPRVQVKYAEIGSPHRSLNGSTIKFNLLPGRTRFWVRIPLKHLLNEPFSLSGCELEARLYDLDEDDRRFTLMSGKAAFPAVGSTPEASR